MLPVRSICYFDFSTVPFLAFHIFVCFRVSHNVVNTHRTFTHLSTSSTLLSLSQRTTTTTLGKLKWNLQARGNIPKYTVLARANYRFDLHIHRDIVWGGFPHEEQYCFLLSLIWLLGGSLGREEYRARDQVRAGSPRFGERRIESFGGLIARFRHTVCLIIWTFTETTLLVWLRLQANSGVTRQLQIQR